MNLAERILKQNYKEVTVKDVSFKIKKIDNIEMMSIVSKIKNNTENKEIEILLSAVVSYKGIKVRDLVDSFEGFTADELDSEIEQNKDLLRMYLGKNQEALFAIQDIVISEFNKQTDKLTAEKKSLSTELNK